MIINRVRDRDKGVEGGRTNAMTKAGGRYLFTTFPLTLSALEVSPLVKLTLNDCITDTAGDCDDDPEIGRAHV